MAKDLGLTVLLDLYGSLLTDTQRETMEMYLELDYSLGEISEQTGITRQGVLNCIRHCEQKLRDLESKLGLNKRMQELRQDISELEAYILQGDMQNEEALSGIDRKLAQIKTKL
jgi:predicted DNA-binding protein YlxM (UPF0122 family)